MHCIFLTHFHCPNHSTDHCPHSCPVKHVLEHHWPSPYQEKSQLPVFNSSICPNSDLWSRPTSPLQKDLLPPISPPSSHQYYKGPYNLFSSTKHSAFKHARMQLGCQRSWAEFLSLAYLTPECTDNIVGTPTPWFPSLQRKGHIWDVSLALKELPRASTFRCRDIQAGRLEVFTVERRDVFECRHPRR